MRCAVLGKPISHSLSPVMHRAAYRELGLDDWTYDAFEVAGSELQAFVRGLDDSWRGLSLTMPLKREIIPLADEVSAVAAALGVANTLVLRDGRLIASNTDTSGATAALVERGVRDPTTTRILGAGATAASVAHALGGLGVRHIDFVVRNPDNAGEAVAAAEAVGIEVTVRRIEQPVIDVVDLLVSTVPESAVRDSAREMVEAAHAVFDVIYDPWPTPLALAAIEAGLPLVSGIDLLAHQAALQVELMTGSRIDVHSLREAALAELASR